MPALAGQGTAFAAAAFNAHREATQMATHSGIFRARLEQVEKSVFKATYRGDMNPSDPPDDVNGSADRLFADSHVGTDAHSVRSFVESLAKNRGYDRVVWE